MWAGFPGIKRSETGPVPDVKNRRISGGFVVSGGLLPAA
jgi:hypothetical protein